MGSQKKFDDPPVLNFGGTLVSRNMLLMVWIPLLLVTFFHYYTPHSYHFVHDILRRVYYLPIVVAALTLGLRGGMFVALVATIAYIPHAFIASHHFDPARGLEKTLEIVLYFVFAGVTGYLSDKKKKHQEELEHALVDQKRLTEQLVRAGRLSALGETVAGIAHEIKNPLHSLAGTAEIVDNVIPKEAEERRMWDLHRQEIERLMKVSDRFLSFARPSPVVMVEMDLQDVAHRLIALAGAQVRQHNISLEMENSTDAVIVKGDGDQLAQIGMNIVLNAIKAIGHVQGTVRVSVGQKIHNDRTMAYLSIQNSGPPIAESEGEHLFDPFRSGTDGTGLGLSISSRIAEQHDGYIAVENGGLGVIFTLYLPLAAQTEQ